jgi:hypothetical protein
MEEAPPQTEENKVDDYETISSGALCALCRSETPASEGRVLGVIALVQQSRILSSNTLEIPPTDRLVAKGQDVGTVTVKPTNTQEFKNRTEPKRPSFKLSSSNSFMEIEVFELLVTW